MTTSSSRPAYCIYSYETCFIFNISNLFIGMGKFKQAEGYEKIVVQESLAGVRSVLLSSDQVSAAITVNAGWKC